MGIEMDGVEGVCVDPGEKGAILELGGPARQKREKAGSWLQTVEEDRCSEMAKDTGDGLATFSRDGYAQSECYCALCSSYTL
jgi:predicted lipoprotein with Yx(FWY)xxD motif